MQCGTLELVDCREPKSLRRKRLFLPASCREILQTGEQTSAQGLFRARKIDMNFLKFLMIFVMGCCRSSDSGDQSFSTIFLTAILFCCMGLFVEVETPRDRA
jgi:hypothetical protein